MSTQSNQPNRRGSKRVSIERDVHFRVVKNRSGKEASGFGKTVNMSSSGVMFTTEQTLPSRCRLELDIDWPAKLDDKCALKFVAEGHLVRSEDGLAVIEIQRYELRTKRSGSMSAGTPLVQK
jgi:hypothetical protein